MKKVTRNVYLYEYESMSFRQRFYIARNEYSINWGAIMPNLNPLKLCILDLLKLIYIPVLVLFIYPFLILPLLAVDAHMLKSRYKNESKSWFHEKTKIIE